MITPVSGYSFDAIVRLRDSAADISDALNSSGNGYGADPNSVESALRQKFGPVYRSHGANGLELITRCPLCRQQKLSVNPRKEVFQCWRGCMTGTLRRLLNGIEIATAAEPEAPRLTPVRAGTVPAGNIIPFTALQRDHIALRYVTERGFDPYELQEHYSVGYCREGKDFANGLFSTSNTLYVPVFENSELIGWQCRLLYNPEKLDDRTCEMLGFPRKDDGTWRLPPKYFTMPGYKKGSHLWNYDNARNSDIVVVTEGVFDAFNVGRCAVATFGKKVSETQARMLSTYWRLIVLLLDNDARKETSELASDLRSRGSMVVDVQLDGYNDAGDTPRQELWRQIRETVNTELSAHGTTMEDYKYVC